MTRTTRADIAKLREALYQEKWSTVKQLIVNLPTTLPPKASSSELAAVLDTVRTAADCFTEACTFTCAFDTVYMARETLIQLGVCEWAANALKSFQEVISVAVPIANVLSVLALSTNGRHHIGSTGAVDLLTKIWRKHPSCEEIVNSLSSLCCGHIDNVSRTMRQRGIVVAIDILNDERYMDNPRLLGKVLLLVGFCTICTPDNTDESKTLVPAIITALKRLNEARMPSVAVRAISALGNMGDCWLKESYGYEFSDAKSLIDAVFATWMANPRSTMVTEAASRTLLVLSTAHSAAKEALLQRAKDMRDTIIVRRKHDSIVEALLSISGTTDEPNSIRQDATCIVPMHKSCEISEPDDADEIQDIFTPSDDEPLVQPSRPFLRSALSNKGTRCTFANEIDERKRQRVTRHTKISDISAEEIHNSADKYALKAQMAVKLRRSQEEDARSLRRRVKTQAAASGAEHSPCKALLRRSKRKRKLPTKLMSDDSSSTIVRTLNEQCKQDGNTIKETAVASYSSTPNSGGKREEDQELAEPRAGKRARRQMPVISCISSPRAQKHSDPVISLISDEGENNAGNCRDIVDRSSVEEEDDYKSAPDKNVTEASPVHVRQTAVAHDLVEWARRRQIQCINN